MTLGVSEELRHVTMIPHGMRKSCFIHEQLSVRGKHWDRKTAEVTIMSLQNSNDY